MSAGQGHEGHLQSSGENDDGDSLAFGTSFSAPPVQEELARLKQKLLAKEMEVANLSAQHQASLSDKNLMENKLKQLQEEAVIAGTKLTEYKAETEAYMRQSQSNQQELAIMRRRSLVGGGGQIITQMYETILIKYEELNSSHEELRKRFADETVKRNKLQKQLETATFNHPDKESMIRQLELMNERMESLQRDLARVRDERTTYKREYSLVMSERDSVLKDMNKLQEDLGEKELQYKEILSEKQGILEEREKIQSQLMILQRGSTSSVDIDSLKQELYAAQRERRQALLDKEAQLQEAYNERKAHDIAMQTIEQISRERDAFRSKVDILSQELEESRIESEAATKWRKLAFSERDKLRSELEESRKLCDLIKEERESLVKQLEEAVKEHDSTKETKNKILGELRAMQTRIELSHNSENTTHSHDSAIDAGDWDGLSQDCALRHRRLVRLLPRQHDVTIELLPVVKFSSVEGLLCGDRLLAVNDVSVAEKSSFQVRDLLNQNGDVEVRLERSYAFQEPNSSHDEMLKNLGRGFPVNGDPGKSPAPDLWDLVRGERRKDHKQKGAELADADGTRTPNDQPHHNHSQVQQQHQLQQPSAVSPDLRHHHGNLSDASPVRMPVETSVPTRKRRGKLNSARFPWARKKPVKTAPSSDTGSTGGSNGGTWPRIDSESLSNIIAGGGRLSVFIKNRPRPAVTPNTFTPPGGHSAGHTPPTAIRGASSMLSSPPSSPPSGSLASSQPVPVRTRPKHGKRRRRPVSAPMAPNNLTTYPIVNANNNNTVKHWKDEVTVGTRAEDRVSSGGSTNRDQVHSPVTPSAEKKQSRPSVTVTPDLSQAATPLSERSTFSYKRQQSYPDGGSHISVSSASIGRVSEQRPRSAYSLPRPSSKGPSLSRSHGGKSRTIDSRRIRIPSEASVGYRSSEPGSITLSDRSTPVHFHPSSSPDPSGGRGSTSRSTSQTDASLSSLSVESSVSSRGRKPVNCEPRYVSMIKGSEPIGISIVKSGDNSGIYVSRVTEHSLAARAGLEFGDQLLEYNGINLRSAREEQARVIMSQSVPGDTIKILAQYNLDKYQKSLGISVTDTLGVTTPTSPVGRDAVTLLAADERDNQTLTPDATPRASPHVEDSLRSQRITEPRYVFIAGGCGNIKLVGGNAYGIYVASVQSNDDTLTASPCDLRIGDKILEFKGTRFENTTLEGASIVMSQASESASMCVIYEPNKFKQIYGVPGDHFYVRALFDHMVEREGALRFNRNSILLVENTFPDYTLGQWVASLVDEQGERSTRGRIPSKLTVEKENSSFALDDVTSSTGSNSGKRLSGSGRRSFFKRRKPHRTSSRSSGDVQLNKSVSETSIESVADGSAFDHQGAYQVVEKCSSDIKRPVIVFGPHSNLVVEKLARENITQFVKCSPVQMTNDDHESIIVESRMHDAVAETLVFTGDLLRRTMTQFPDRHVLLEMSVDAIDRLYSMHIYPIIVFIKYPSSKKIKESQDRSFDRAKLSGKQCKELMERYNAVERKLMSKYYGTVCISGGTSHQVAGKISKVVSHEHSKVLWLPSKNSPLRY